MALGVDTLAAEVCLENNIPLVAAIPFKGQENIWPKESREKYYSILEQCEYVEYICDPGYAPWKMNRRNEWMVDHSNKLIAVFDGSKGGTFNCIQYALKKKKEIVYIDPKEIL